jgi:AcrR family transcriptional regulator
MQRTKKLSPAKAGAGGRARILDAVASLLVDRGPGSVSVDNILTVSGLSKGGFFYHFKTKQEALLAAFEAQVEQVDRLVMDRAEADGLGNGSVLKAYVRTILDPMPGTPQRLLESTVRTLVALLNDDPALMPQVTRIFRNSEMLLADDQTPWETRVMICETVEGIWISRALGIGHYTAGEESRIMAHVLNLIATATTNSPVERKSKINDSRSKPVKSKRS